MKIKKLSEKILDLDGKSVTEIKIELVPLINQLKSGQSNAKMLIEQLEKIQEEKAKDLTYKKLYEEAVFNFQSQEADKFAEAYFIAQKLKDDDDFTPEEIVALKERIPGIQRSGMVKGLAIVNLNDYTKEEGKKK